MIRALAEKLGLEVGIYKTQQDDLDSGIQVVKEAMENTISLLQRVEFL